jgi:hypothetical protein
MVFYSLLGNMIVSPYFGIALTDGFTAILLVYVVYAILKIFTCTLQLMEQTRPQDGTYCCGF